MTTTNNTSETTTVTITERPICTGRPNLLVLGDCHVKLDCNALLRWSCLTGDLDTATTAARFGATDWNGALICACRGGHRKLVDFAVSSGADDWYAGLHEAYTRNHEGISRAMVSLIIDA